MTANNIFQRRLAITFWKCTQYYVDVYGIPHIYLLLRHRFKSIENALNLQDFLKRSDWLPLGFLTISYYTTNSIIIQNEKLNLGTHNK